MPFPYLSKLWPLILKHGLLLLRQKPIVDGNRLMAPDLKAYELSQSQVILQFSLGSTTHALLGPLLTFPEAQETQPFFPCVPDQSILASQKEIFIKQFVLSKHPFRNPPKNTP